MNILVPAFTGLGNTILLTPLLRAIKSHIPESKVYLWGDNKYGGLELIPSDLYFKLVVCQTEEESFKKLKDTQFEAGFFSLFDIYHWNVKVAKKIKVKKIMRGYSAQTYNSWTIKSKLKFILDYLNPCIELVPFIPSRNEVDLNLDLLEFYLRKHFQRDLQTTVNIPNLKNNLLLNQLKGAKYICIQPSAANGGPSPKRWSLEKFQELIKLIQNKYSELKIVLLGDAGDVSSFSQVIHETDKVINFAGKTSLQECVNLVNQSELVICHDSGIMHMANALKKPLIALYGPTNIHRTKPLGENSRILKSMDEYFCSLYDERLSEQIIVNRDSNKVSMSKIYPEEVLTEVSQFLGG